MCGRLNQFEELSLFRFAGIILKAQRRKAKEREDRRAARQVVLNICPTDYADVLTSAEDGVGVERMRFGLVPFWAKGPKEEVWKKFARTFNARCETVFELASYRGVIKRRRCIVPVRGWHEWPDRTTPYYIHRADDEPLMLAGIWDTWESREAGDEQDGAVVTSMSIITTPPGRYMAKFHDRSPLVLEGENVMAWMQPGLAEDDIKAMFQPFESRALEAYRVSTTVNQARNKTAEVLEPVADAVPQDGD